MYLKQVLGFIGVALLLLAGCKPYKKLSTTNLVYRYEENVPLTLRSVVLDKGDSLKVFLALHARKISKDVEAKAIGSYFSFYYNLQADYGSTTKLSTDTLHFKQAKRDALGTFYLDFSIKKQPIPSALIALHVKEQNNGRTVIFDIPVSFASPQVADNYALFKSGNVYPIFWPYISTSDTILLRSLNQPAGRPLYLKHFDAPFMPALPPMSLNPVAPKKPPLKNFYTIATDQLLLFKEGGLYYVQEDSAQKTGFSLLVKAGKFPRATQPEELIEPLVYITTKEERTRLANAKKPKEALDQFWLDAGGNRENARRIIRAYYENVENANTFFTTYKEGWKTDMGMVYIIFGKPDKVLRETDSEVWYYQKNANFPEVYFKFVRKPVIFTNDNFELVRDREYERFWYGTVEQWRKGILGK